MKLSRGNSHVTLMETLSIAAFVGACGAREVPGVVGEGGADGGAATGGGSGEQGGGAGEPVGDGGGAGTSGEPSCRRFNTPRLAACWQPNLALPDSGVGCSTTGYAMRGLRVVDAVEPDS